MKISKNEMKCEVPENIPTSHRGQREIPRGRGSKRRQFPGGCEGLLFRVFFLRASSKIGELLKTKSCSVKQTNSFFFIFIFFTVNDLLKQELLS